MGCQPLISVVVTCYNYGRYLKGCLESVLSQTYKNYEILVIDDGSTDNTAEVIAPFRELSNLKYIHQSNEGQARAKNVGISISSGEFVAFLDADDLWSAEKLEKQMALFNDRGVGVVYCRAKFINEINDVFDTEMTATYLQPRRGIVSDWLFLDNFVPFSSSIVRKECLERFGMFDETLKMGIDWDLWLRISTAYKFDYVDEHMFYYRIGHSGQMSKNLEERQRCTDHIMQKFISDNPGLLTSQTVKSAYVYTYCNRGEYFKTIDRGKSNRYFVDAIKLQPTQTRAYKGLINNLLRKFVVLTP